MAGMRPYLQPFYSSGAWKACSEDYRKAHPLCERCLAKGEISASEQVHHKIRLTPETVKDPRVALNWGNLEALCGDCHKAEHRRKTLRRWRCDERGHVTAPLGQ